MKQEQCPDSLSSRHIEEKRNCLGDHHLNKFLFKMIYIFHTLSVLEHIHYPESTYNFQILTLK